MSMSIDRAIEIVNPTTEDVYSPTEWIEAHRMACQALALLRWKDAKEDLPQNDDFVLGVCWAELGKNAWMEGAIALVEYSELDNRWYLDGYPEVEDVRVTHWMRLPTLPEGVEP